MRANRRGVLRTLGAVAFGGLAGCTGDGSLLPRGLSGSAVAPEWDDPARAAKLVPDDGDALDGFGVSVSLSREGTTALAGARYDEDLNGDRAGSAYVFSRADREWRQQAKIAPEDGDEGDRFGVSCDLAADGRTALVGSFRDDVGHGEDAGSAYVYRA